MASGAGAGSSEGPVARLAEPEELGEAARLLHDFNTEFEDPSPGPTVLAERLALLDNEGDTLVLLIGEPPLGIAVLRFRRWLWGRAEEAYLEELYVVPERRGEGLGRRLMDRVLDEARRRGSGRIDLGTAETDTAARSLYESLGFTNLEDGAPMLFYERDL